jgi:N-acetylneuraminic acid mutarotase
LTTLFCLIFITRLPAADEAKFSPLPTPISNNAVAISHDSGDSRIFSFMGIGPKKTWDAVTGSSYELNPATGKWKELRPVPGVAGRLGASAVALHDQVFIFGGYVVDGQGGETTVPDLNVFVPAENRYYRGKDIPVPVADAVVGLYHDRYIFVIGGRSTADAESKDGGAVRNVQIYDTDKDTWTQATPIPGTPVFGHAGAIVGDTIVFVDGARKNTGGANPKYIASSDCWMGTLPSSKKGDITKIEWSQIVAHPGSARFRIAAGAGASDRRGGKIYFSGGSDAPYDYKGIGYNGKPAEPSALTFAYDIYSNQWETVNEDVSEPTMDHRGMLVMGHKLVVVGGMRFSQQVTGNVTVVNLGGRK